MKRAVMIIFLIMIISIAACQQTVKKEPAPVDVMKKTETQQPPKTQTDAAEDAAVEAVGNDLNSTESVENDLNADELNGWDSGFSDVDNI